MMSGGPESRYDIEDAIEEGVTPKSNTSASSVMPGMKKVKRPTSPRTSRVRLRPTNIGPINGAYRLLLWLVEKVKSLPQQSTSFIAGFIVVR
jgi:hypothetical protein